jgi:hypothetical protein
MRHAPRQRGDGSRLETPERPWWDKSPETPDEDQTNSFERKNVPDWLDAAWSILDGDPSIEDALLVYHQGLILQQEDRESFAMIAFVASIEAIGLKLGRLERCSKCGTMIGSSRRFRQALALVVPDEERRKTLAKMVYDQRSTTAHRGRLHGTEAAPGTLAWAAGSFLARDPVWEFTSRLHQIRTASRNLLLRVLRERLELSAERDG